VREKNKHTLKMQQQSSSTSVASTVIASETDVKENMPAILTKGAIDENGNTVAVDIELPRWDQKTYWGRANHFYTVTNPANLFVTPSQLEHAKDVVTRYRKGEDLKISLDELWDAKHLYDSAFHPDTGDKMFWAGRMSAQVPMGMAITGALLTFYKTTPQVVFWQWFNQSFNAMVNYTNRSGDSPISVSVLGTAYVSATTGALVTALGLNSLVKTAPPLIGRFVPSAAVAAANCVNIPLMRQLELKNGIPLVDKDGEKVDESSKIAAKRGISMVTASRIGMAAPGMLLIPVLMNALDRRGLLAKYPRLLAPAPLQTALCGFFLTFTTPLCCAFFEQYAPIKLSSLEEDIQNRLLEKGFKHSDTLYYNKGL